MSEFPLEKRVNHRKSGRTRRTGTYKSKFRSVGTQTDDDNVYRDDVYSAAGNNNAVSTSRSKKRKRAAPASDSEKDEDVTEPEDNEEMEVEHGYGSEARWSSDNEEGNGEADEVDVVDSPPQVKKPRLAARAEELARQLLEEDSDEEV